MTSIYDDAGKYIACTVVEAGPNIVTQVKTDDSDGYFAMQLGFGEAKPKNTSQQMKGHFEKVKTSPKQKLVEFRDFPWPRQLETKSPSRRFFSRVIPFTQ